jgi:hypothetical protein
MSVQHNNIIACIIEMEFLDINLTKDSSLLLHVTYSLSLLLVEKTILFSDFKKPDKKSAKQTNSRLFMNNILYNEK